jgi:hypothetical protein
MKLRCWKKIRTTQAYVFVYIYSQEWIKDLILAFWHFLFFLLKKKKECILIFYSKMGYMIRYLDLTNLSKNIYFSIYGYLMETFECWYTLSWWVTNIYIYIYLAQDISKTTLVETLQKIHLNFSFFNCVFSFGNHRNFMTYIKCHHKISYGFIMYFNKWMCWTTHKYDGSLLTLINTFLWMTLILIQSVRFYW